MDACMILGAIPDYVTATAAGVAAYVAVRGLHTWRLQLRGHTEYDLSRRLLRAVLEVRDQIAYVRSPFISGGEMAAAFREAGLDPDSIDLLADKRTDELVYQTRWNSLAKALSAFQVELLEAEVLWGPAVRTAQAALQACVNTLYGAVLEHLDMKRDPELVKAMSRDDRRRVREVLYARPGRTPEDKLAADITKAVEAFEALLRPHLELRQ